MELESFEIFNKPEDFKQKWNYAKFLDSNLLTWYYNVLQVLTTWVLTSLHENFCLHFYFTWFHSPDSLAKYKCCLKEPEKIFELSVHVYTQLLKSTVKYILG